MGDSLELEQLLLEILPDLKNYVDDSLSSHQPLRQNMDLSGIQNIFQVYPLNNEPTSKEKLLSCIKDLLKYSTKVYSPRFMDKLFGGSQPIGAISELIIGLLNNNAHVFQTSPVVTWMEKQVLEKMNTFIGWQSEAGGVLCPGGAYSNLLAVTTARNFLFPDILKNGIDGKKLVVLTTATSHYSIRQSVQTIGLGDAGICLVPTNASGHILVERLPLIIEKLIQEGKRPFFFNITNGTTVTGCFESAQQGFRQMVQICRQNKIWIHVDGSWGASSLLLRHQPEFQDIWQGVEGVDSLTWNPHKLLGVPLLCSALLVRDKNLLEVNRVDAKYLYHQQENDFWPWEMPSPQSESQFKFGSGEESITLNLGQRTLGCGRRADAIKLYLSWLYYGTTGFQNRVQNSIQNAQIFTQMITQYQAKGEFVLLFKPEFVNVCFWYLPPFELLRHYLSIIMNIPISITSSHQLMIYIFRNNRTLYYKLMNRFTTLLHQKMKQKSLFMVDYAPLSLLLESSQEWQSDCSYLMEALDEGYLHIPKFWRLIPSHLKLTRENLFDLLQEMDQLGSQMF